MTLYCLHEGFYEGVQLRLDQLRNASQKLGINFVSIDGLRIDHTKLPRLGKGDLLYNCARGGQILESILLNHNVTTFYIKTPQLNQSFSTTDFSILHDKEGLPSPKTIYHLTDNRVNLQNYVEYLGGFPVILKVIGGTRGIGTVKIESWHSLISTVDYLMTTNDKFILREFIDAKVGCRMMVLGDKVIAAAGFTMNKNDFRNAAITSEIKYFKRQFPKSLVNLAVRATHIANVSFSGVDFLEDSNGKFYLLEVNFPTGFSSLIDICEVDIPLKMVEYLKKKAISCH